MNIKTKEITGHRRACNGGTERGVRACMHACGQNQFKENLEILFLVYRKDHEHKFNTISSKR